MTVSTTTGRTSYAGDGSTTAFAVPWPFKANTDVAAYLVASDGSYTTLTYSTHYSVTGAGTASGGTLTMVTAPASGQVLVIVRQPPLTQPTDYRVNDSFPAETHEAALDRIVMQLQWVQAQVDRALRVSLVENPPGLVASLSGNDGKVLGLVSGALSWVNPDGSSSASNLGIPTSLAELTGSDFLVVQTAGTEGTATARYVDIREILGLGYDRLDHVSSAAIADLDLIHTNVGAAADVTLTLPAADAGLMFVALKSRTNAYALTITPGGTDQIDNGAAGGSLTFLTPGLLVLTCIETGYWESAGSEALFVMEE